jgi:hypothetical protein
MADQLSPERRAILDRLRNKTLSEREHDYVADELQRLWLQEHPKAKKLAMLRLLAICITAQIAAVADEREIAGDRKAVEHAEDDVAEHWRSIDGSVLTKELGIRLPHFTNGRALNKWLRRHHSPDRDKVRRVAR